MRRKGTVNLTGNLSCAMKAARGRSDEQETSSKSNSEESRLHFN